MCGGVQGGLGSSVPQTKTMIIGHMWKTFFKKVTNILLYMIKIKICKRLKIELMLSYQLEQVSVEFFSVYYYRIMIISYICTHRICVYPLHELCV